MNEEQQMFETCDAFVGNTMIVFSDRRIADRYIIHQYNRGVRKGMIAMAEDTRGKTGLCVMLRDPVPGTELQERIGNCLWLLEETLAGRSPWPEAGRVVNLGKVGGQNAQRQSRSPCNN